MARAGHFPDGRARQSAMARADAANQPVQSPAEVLAGRLRRQAFECNALGSRLYADVIERVAVDVEQGGPSLAVLTGYDTYPFASALALRLMGAIHRIVLDGRAPALAAHYPSAGGDGDAHAAWPPLLDLIRTHTDEVRTGLDKVPQTNEVGRSAALMPGFLRVASRTGLPLRLREVGSSAGLNLRWDHYRYEVGDAVVGERSSPLVFDRSWFDGELADATASVPINVVDRRGCDRSPIDPASDEG